MRILVYGAGVLGSRYAAALHQAGYDVTILARGERFQQIKEQGIILETINTGEREVTHLPVVDVLAPEDAYELVLVLMRSSQVADILPALAANRHTPNVLFLGNNIHGADAMTQALGRERVLLGFAGAGGVREGAVVRFMYSDENNTYLGELDGGLTPRLEWIEEVFEITRFPIHVVPDIQAWLKTHVAFVMPLAYGIYMCGGDNYRLAHTRDALVLVVRAIREGFNALRAVGIPITPRVFGGMMRLPEPLLVAFMGRFLNTQHAEIGLAGHANAARDEMQHLGRGLLDLMRSSGVATPSYDSLYMYNNPQQPPVNEGSRQIALNMRELWLAAAALAGTVGLLALLVKTLRRKR